MNLNEDVVAEIVATLEHDLERKVLKSRQGRNWILGVMLAPNSPVRAVRLCQTFSTIYIDQPSDLDSSHLRVNGKYATPSMVVALIEDLLVHMVEEEA